MISVNADSQRASQRTFQEFLILYWDGRRSALRLPINSLRNSENLHFLCYYWKDPGTPGTGGSRTAASGPRGACCGPASTFPEKPNFWTHSLKCYWSCSPKVSRFAKTSNETFRFRFSVSCSWIGPVSVAPPVPRNCLRGCRLIGFLRDRWCRAGSCWRTVSPVECTGNCWTDRRGKDFSWSGTPRYQFPRCNSFVSVCK